LSTEAGVRPQGANLSYSKEIDFDSFALEKIPAGFVPILLGAGKEVSWIIKAKAEPSAPR